MERNVCCRLCSAPADAPTPENTACDWCVEQEAAAGNSVPTACNPCNHSQDSWRTNEEWRNKEEAGTDLPPNTHVRVRMKVMPGNNPYREWHMRCPDCQETLIVDRVGQPFVSGPVSGKESRSQASDLLRHMAGVRTDGSWRCTTWAPLVERRVEYAAPKSAGAQADSGDVAMVGGPAKSGIR